MITLTQKSQLAASITEQVKMAAIATAKNILDADKVNAMFYGSEAAYNLLTQQAQRIVRLSADNNRGIINALAEIIAASATTESLTDAQIEAAMQGAIEKLAGIKAENKAVKTTVETTWKAGIWVNAGDALTFNGKRYLVNQAHKTQAGWEPDKASALFRQADLDAATGFPVWVQPQGAHDAYAKGVKVVHKSKTWENLIDANVWEPGVYGWKEVV
jgi:hypothetical protein